MALAGCHLLVPYKERPDAGTPDNRPPAPHEAGLDRAPGDDLPGPDLLPDMPPMPDLKKPDGPASTVAVTTLAGTGTPGKADGPTKSASFKQPHDVVVGSAGEVYVADTENHKIRKIQGGKVTTFAGTGSPGYRFDVYSKARFHSPMGMDFYHTAAGDKLYVADNKNHRLRLMDQFLGKVFNVAGNGTGGHKDTQAHQSMLNYPTDVAYAGGAVYYIADSMNQVIRKLAGGNVSTIAGKPGEAKYVDGTAGAARFSSPTGITACQGTIFVADRYNNAIRAISGGKVNTLAGGTKGHKDAKGTAAQFRYPTDVEADSSCTLYVADTGNHAVRMIKGAQVTTLAGGSPGFSDGDFNTARFKSPRGIAVDASGKVYVADTGNHAVRLITP